MFIVDLQPDNCPVCLEALTTVGKATRSHEGGTEVSEATRSHEGGTEESCVVIKPCNHVLHYRCAKAMYEQTCPLCRGPLVPLVPVVNREIEEPMSELGHVLRQHGQELQRRAEEQQQRQYGPEIVYLTQNLGHSLEFMRRRLARYLTPRQDRLFGPYCGIPKIFLDVCILVNLLSAVFLLITGIIHLVRMPPTSTELPVANISQDINSLRSILNSSRIIIQHLMKINNPIT